MKHPGFASVQSSIAARQGIPMRNAGAILASSTRKASSAAKKKNPRLRRVKMAGLGGIKDLDKDMM